MQFDAQRHSESRIVVRAISSEFERFRAISGEFERCRAISSEFGRYRAISGEFGRFLSISHDFERFYVIRTNLLDVARNWSESVEIGMLWVC
jgi:hypothetical protein